jgi:hypothetical protein
LVDLGFMTELLEAESVASVGPLKDEIC